MRYIGDIVTAARRRTNNEDFTVDSSGVTTAGMGDDLILEFANDGQQHLQAAIIGVYPQEFTDDQFISMVGSQEAYDLAENIFINNKILHVQYSSTGNVADYQNLPQRTLNDRITSPANHPSFYIRRSGQLLFNPIPVSSTGVARVTYYRMLDRVDIRRGQISAKLGTNPTVTQITLDVGTDDPLALSTAQYVCINDQYGNVEMYNVPVQSYDSATGILAIGGGTYTGDTTETVTVGSYVTVGRYTTTHSKLPNDCERYLKLYTQVRMLEKDSSADAADEQAQLDRMGEEILTNFANITEDIEEIPVIDTDLIL